MKDVMIVVCEVLVLALKLASISLMCLLAAKLIVVSWR